MTAPCRKLCPELPCSHSRMANKRSLSPEEQQQERKRKVASPSLLLLQSQKSQDQMSCLIQSSDQVQDDQNLPSVSAAATASGHSEDNLSTNMSSSTSSTSTTTSITETFGSSLVMEDSYQPRTSILGSTGGEPPDCWRKSSADTTHDVSELEMDPEMTDLAWQEEERRRSRKQCTLL